MPTKNGFTKRRFFLLMKPGNYENKIALHPNPGTASVFLVRNLSEVIIYDLNGKLVLALQNYKNNEAISVESFKSGVYIVNILDDTAAYQIKLIKD